MIGLAFKGLEKWNDRASILGFKGLEKWNDRANIIGRQKKKKNYGKLKYFTMQKYNNSQNNPLKKKIQNFFFKILLLTLL